MTAVHNDPSPDADPAPDSGPVTPRGLIRLVRDAHTRREQADRDVLGLALEWATLHEVAGPVCREQSGPAASVGEGSGEFPDPPAPDAEDPARVDDVDLVETEARREWRGLPEITWDSAAPFAAAVGLSTRGGRTLLRHALTLAHRLPATQIRWQTHQADTRTARKVADTLAGQPDDVCAWVDRQIARRLDAHGTIGPVILDRLLAEALAELHAEQVELDREEQLHDRYAKYAPGADIPDLYGLAEYVIRGDWPDVKAFDDTLAALAEAIRCGEGPDGAQPLDVRRSIAVGILSDPLRAAALLGLDFPTAAGEPAPQASRSPDGSRRQQKVLVTFHLGADAVAGLHGTRWVAGRDPVGPDADGRPWLDSVIREWVGRPDVALTVRPVIHCGGCPSCATYCEDRHTRHSYAPTSLDKERLALRTPRCVFPHCTMPTRRCDADHTVPYHSADPTTPGGPTCPACNLAPLCRHHHRLKTHAGWTYRQLEPGVFTWTEPHGQAFLTTSWGTRDTTDQHTDNPQDRDGP